MRDRPLEREYVRCDHVPSGAVYCQRHGLTEATEMGECARCVKPRTPESKRGNKP